LYYHRVPEDWHKEQKLFDLGKAATIEGISWDAPIDGSAGTWISAEHADEFAGFVPVASKETKANEAIEGVIFQTYSVGVKTNRDDVVYDFQRDTLEKRVRQFIDDYNVDRYKRAGKNVNVDDFVRYDRIKWSRDLKLDLHRGNYADYAESKIRVSLYRAYSHRYLFFDRRLNEEIYAMPHILPSARTSRTGRWSIFARTMPTRRSASGTSFIMSMGCCTILSTARNMPRT
jgi:predicted helicase